jgi:hypothetical protein
MDLKGILSVSGKPGLYKLVGQLKNGIVIESLEDGKRFPAYATDKVSALEDISMYSEEEEIPLAEIFSNIRTYMAEGGEIKGNASGKELKAQMEAVFPEYDRDRVYTSDMKKLFKWYLSLEKAGLAVEVEASSDGVEDAEIIESTDEADESND